MENINLEDAIMARRGPRKGWNIAKTLVGVGCGLCATYAATQVLTPFVIGTLPHTNSAVFTKVVKGAAYVGTSAITGAIGTAVMEQTTESLDSMEWLYDASRLAMDARVSEAEAKMEELRKRASLETVKEA